MLIFLINTLSCFVGCCHTVSATVSGAAAAPAVPGPAHYYDQAGGPAPAVAAAVPGPAHYYDRAGGDDDDDCSIVGEKIIE